mmetsp:Transcript_16542/g.45381  ORF Transcript_16542/g.45381 Transcript_16542/m.45381 type:complete len:233 (-) Transcript_16542:1185-1883(-)
MASAKSAAPANASSIQVARPRFAGRASKGTSPPALSTEEYRVRYAAAALDSSSAVLPTPPLPPLLLRAAWASLASARTSARAASSSLAAAAAPSASSFSLASNAARCSRMVDRRNEYALRACSAPANCPASTAKWASMFATSWGVSLDASAISLCNCISFFSPSVRCSIISASLSRSLFAALPWDCAWLYDCSYFRLHSVSSSSKRLASSWPCSSASSVRLLNTVISCSALL